MSPIIDDLRVEAEIPPQSLRPGTRMVVTLRFSNLGTRARKLFLIDDEAHRGGQSSFHLQIGSGPPVVQPPPSPGYQPTKADFRDIGPRGRLELPQLLRLPRDLAPGRYQVKWVYENEVTHYPSVPGLPGTPGTPGAPIPGIWVGRIEDVFEIQVGRVIIRTEPR